jgi:hypothetical protein
MKSDLNVIEFKKRLAELTVPEKHVWLFSPFESSGKPFCGTFDDSTFELTRNSFWTHVKAIVVKGEYKQLDSNSTEVRYTVGLSKFVRIYSIILLCIVLTTIFFHVIKDRLHVSIFFPVMGFIGLMILLQQGVSWITKKIVGQRFNEEFEIDVEDEWEKLANDIVRDRRK